jgi:predicted methyltransferase
MNKSKQRALIAILFFVLSLSIVSGQNTSRDRLMQPEKLMDSIGAKEGMIIGEGGAGRGYFTFKLARRVGPNGHVYANDIDRSSLDSIQRQCRQDGISNISTILGEVDDPLFPETELDIIFMIAAFHDFARPVAWLENVKSSLKPGALLVIVEKDPDKIGGSSHHMTKDEILATVKKADFELVKIETFLRDDNIFVFRSGKNHSFNIKILSSLYDSKPRNSPLTFNCRYKYYVLKERK